MLFIVLHPRLPVQVGHGDRHAIDIHVKESLGYPTLLENINSFELYIKLAASNVHRQIPNRLRCTITFQACQAWLRV